MAGEPVVYVNEVAGMALPNLVGQDFNTVQNNWANPNHIQLSQMQVANNQPQGIIVRQSPAPNTPVAQGETVTVYVSSGPPQVAIPGDLRGQHFGQVSKSCSSSASRSTASRSAQGTRFSS